MESVYNRIKRAATTATIAVSLLLLAVYVGCRDASAEKQGTAPASTTTPPDSQISEGPQNWNGHHDVKAAVGFLGDLRIGMKRHEAFARLPKGIAADDLKGPVSFKGGDIAFWNGTFPASRLPIFNEAELPDSTVAQIALAFVRDRLLAIGISAPEHMATPEVKGAIVRSMNKHYGLNVEMSASEDSTGVFWGANGTDECYLRAFVGRGYTIQERQLRITVVSDEYYDYSRGDTSEPMTDYGAIWPVWEYIKPVRGFESLKLGMTEQEAWNNLPWGLTREDLPYKWLNDEDNEIRFYYAEELSPSLWEALTWCEFDESVNMQFVLGFTDNGLELIMLVLPSAAVDLDALQVIKADIKRRYGANMVHMIGPEASYEEWWFCREDADVIIRKGLDDSEGLLKIWIMTDKGSKLYDSLLELDTKH
jgi:hypothetical protein